MHGTKGPEAGCGSLLPLLPDASCRSAQGAEAWAHTLQRWQREERGQWQVCQARHGSLQAKRWQLRRGPGSQAGVLELQCPTAGCCVAAEECTRHPPVHTLIRTTCMGWTHLLVRLHGCWGCLNSSPTGGPGACSQARSAQ
jgi:hypothetical protein